jgi:hypothetical protein
MSDLTISAAGFTIQPLVDERDGPAEIRWYYNRAFLDSVNTQVQWGTGTTGFWVTTPCSVAAGLVTVDQDTLLWTTDDAQDPNPGSILLSAGLYSSRGKLVQQLTIIGKSQWIVPSSQAPTTTWANFVAYNSAAFLANPPQVFYTAAQVDALVDRSFDEHPATDGDLGSVLLSVPATVPAQPVVWGANDPLVRDALKIQGVDVVSTTPLDTQVLAYNQSNNQWEPSNQAAGTGNVVSNEIISVDGEITLFSGTGGKTIKRGGFTGLLKALAGVVSAAVAAVDYVVPGVITGSGLTQATARLLGRTTASSGAVEEISVGTGLQLAAGVLSNTAADTGITQLTGNVTAGPGSGSQVATIPSDTVIYAMMQNVSAADKLLGRGNSGAGDVQEITLGTNLAMSGTTLNASAGTGTVGNVGTLTTNQVILGAGGTDITALGSLGTTVTVLHGNAAGAPTFAVVTPADAAGNTSGSGNFALVTSPVFTTPTLGAATATSVNGLTITSSTGTLTITNAKVVSFNHSLTFAGTDSTTMTFPSTSQTIVGLTATQTLTSKIISLTAAHGTDDTCEGLQVTGLNAGATIAQWETVYLDGSSTWQLADANGSSTYPARGLATAAYVSTNPAAILVRGTVRNDAWNWTPGGALYLSGTPGGLTQTAPSTSGDKVQVVGFALTADIAFFDFNSTYLTVT